VNEHPIQGLMKTAMEALKEMVDVNTIIGEPVETPDGAVILPVSRVAFGFAAGGGEYEVGNQGNRGGNPAGETALPFGGGSGAGVSIQPVGMLVVSADAVRFLPVDPRAFYDRLIDLAPQVLSELRELIRPGNGAVAGRATPPGAPAVELPGGRGIRRRARQPEHDVEG